MKTNFSSLASLRLSWVLAVGVLATCSANADEEQDLIGILTSNVAAPQKCDACQKLRLVGTVKSVPALASLLREAPTAHAARYALEGLPFPEAIAAMRDALAGASGSVKAGLIDSLGWRRDAAAVPLLSKALTEPDAAVASSAATALGRIGGRNATAALTDACEKAPPAVEPAVLDGLSRCADQLLAEGNANGAAAVYRKLLAPKFSDSTRAAAWRGLALADTAGRADLVTQALVGHDRALYVASLKVLRELDDPALVETCFRQWPALPADAQVAVLDARLKLGGDRFAVISEAMKSHNPAVRVAAWQALGETGDAQAIPTLAAVAAHSDSTERDAAREALARMHGPGVSEAFLQQLRTAEQGEKVELLRALGRRVDAGAVGVLLENAAASQPAVRLAAFESLRLIASPDSAVPLLALAAKAKSEAEAEPALNALYAVCQSSADKEQTGAALLASMNRMSPAERRLVLPLLAELGTPAALQMAQAAALERDPESAKEALRVLAQWPNAAPAPALLELAGTMTDPTLQVLALRAGISVAGQEPDPGKRLELLQKALTTAKRPDEKKQALGQIGQTPTREALQVSEGYLADAELSTEAGLAALAIAEKLAGSAPQLAKETADKVIAQCKSPEIVKRAWAIRGKPAGSGPFIQDWLVCGPFSKPGVTGALALFDVAFGPEASDPRAEWKPLPRAKIAELSGFFPEQVNCVAYLKTQIIVPRASDAALLLGSDDGVKAWLNGAVVHSNNVDRGLVEDQDMVPIQLKQGTNQLMLKVTQGGGGWAACARIVGANGRPIQGLQVQVDR